MKLKNSNTLLTCILLSENENSLPETGNKKDFTNYLNFDETQKLQLH